MAVSWLGSETTKPDPPLTSPLFLGETSGTAAFYEKGPGLYVKGKPVPPPGSRLIRLPMTDVLVTTSLPATSCKDVTFEKAEKTVA